MQHKPPVSVTGKARETLAKILDHVLADECRLSATIRVYRWNVTGPHFHSLHKLFDEQRRQLDAWLVRLFRRTQAAGISARGNVAVEDLTQSAVAPAGSGAGLPARQMIDDLLARHEVMARTLRDDVARLADPATAELLQRIADFHETTAWMLRMLLEGPDASEENRFSSAPRGFGRV